MLKIFDRGWWVSNYIKKNKVMSVPNLKLGNIRKILIRIIILMQMVKVKLSQAYATSSEIFKRVVFDSDGVPFIMDNSANCYIYIVKSYFEDLHEFTAAEKKLIGSIGTVGENATPSRVGNIQLTWIDDKEVNHTYIIENVYYVLNLPVNLIGVTKFGK